MKKHIHSNRKQSKTGEDFFSEAKTSLVGAFCNISEETNYDTSAANRQKLTPVDQSITCRGLVLPSSMYSSEAGKFSVAKEAICVNRVDSIEQPNSSGPTTLPRSFEAQPISWADRTCPSEYTYQSSMNTCTTSRGESDTLDAFGSGSYCLVGNSADEHICMYDPYADYKPEVCFAGPVPEAKTSLVGAFCNISEETNYDTSAANRQKLTPVDQSITCRGLVLPSSMSSSEAGKFSVAKEVSNASSVHPRNSNEDCMSGGKITQAFISLVSMNKFGCALIPATDPGCHPCLTKDFDPGWNAETFHLVFRHIASRISESSLTQEAWSFLQKWIGYSYVCSKFLDNKLRLAEHLEKKIHEQLGISRVMIYPLRAVQHCVYIEMYKKAKEKYRITIFNLGAGRAAECEQYQPIEFDNLSLGQFDEKLSELTGYDGKNSILKMKTYDTEDNQCTLCTVEFPQSTGNCVVKNFLAAMQQDAIDCYEYDENKNEGLEIFSALYVALLGACLSLMEQDTTNHKIPELPDFDAVCDLVENNQIAFTDDVKEKLRPIAAQYTSWRSKVIGVKSDSNVCFDENIATASKFADSSKVNREGANTNSQRRKSRNNFERKIINAENRTDMRLEKFSVDEYFNATVREIAKQFDKLKLSIFNPRNTEHTNTNKTIFRNKFTGWYVCYDKHGNYCTIHNDYDHYVAWDSTTDAKGKGKKYHFYNVKRPKN